MNHSATQERIDAEIKVVGHWEKKGALVRAQLNLDGEGPDCCRFPTDIVSAELTGVRHAATDRILRRFVGPN